MVSAGPKRLGKTPWCGGGHLCLIGEYDTISTVGGGGRDGREELEEVEVGEEGEEVEDDGEEARVARVRRAPRGPTQMERGLHELTRLPNRGWCGHCAWMRREDTTQEERSRERGGEDTRGAEDGAKLSFHEYA